MWDKLKEIIHCTLTGLKGKLIKGREMLATATLNNNKGHHWEKKIKRNSISMLEILNWDAKPVFSFDK